jgi:hypothetical protein
MTEAEWLACTDWTPMLEYLRGLASDRKLRLFAVACCRRMWHLLTESCQRAVGLAERYCDGLATADEWAAAKSVAEAAFEDVHSTNGNSYTASAVISLIGKCYVWFPSFDIVECARVTAAESSVAIGVSADMNLTDAEERVVQVTLLRDIFGNPFRPLPDRPEAIAPLAERIYAGEWGLMPLLGEWLQEHGYWSEGEHCLDPNNQHVKGCWVVDWVTGRE